MAKFSYKVSIEVSDEEIAKNAKACRLTVKEYLPGIGISLEEMIMEGLEDRNVKSNLTVEEIRG